MSEPIIAQESAEPSTPQPSPIHPDAPPPDGAPVAEAESTAKEAGAAPAGGQHIGIGTAEGDGYVFDSRTIGVNVESQTFQLYHARSAIRHFTCADLEPVPAEWERDSALCFRGPDSEVDALLKHLEERRVLVLSAQRGAGKVKAALYLGWHLRQLERCTRGTLLVESLGRKVRLDVRQLAASDRDLRNRLVIFSNAFSRADPEVTRLFETTDRSGWQALAEQLRARGAYLVFTTDPAEAGSLERLPAHGVRRDLSPHPPDLLAGELERKLDSLAETGADAALVSALREGSDWVAATFRYAPQVLEFADRYVEMGIAGLELGEAWRRMQNAGGRILQDLDGDFEGWSFAFTLALAECGCEAGGVAWVELDRLHRHVRQWLRRDLNLRYPDTNGAEVDADADADTRLEFSDTRLLERARAGVDMGAASYTVRFRDGAAPDEMWAAMLLRHRRALLTVLPGLRGLAERGDEELGTLRALAARIIGRIGEMDALRITLPLMDRWARSGKAHWQAALGPLVDGALSSRNERYRLACLGHLQKLQRGQSPGENPDAHLPAVLAAWSWVGDHDLALAMRELGAIVHDRLVPLAGEARGIARMYAEQEDALLGVHLSVSSLCATRGPVAVFTELRRWIAEDGANAGVVVALMFLMESGIADQLKQPRAKAAGLETGCNPLAMWLAGGEAEVRQTSRFLGELFESLLAPFAASAHLQRYCVERLQEHLADWASDALPVPEHADAMRSLFEALFRTHDGVLRDPLLNLLEGSRFADGDYAMRAFAASVPRNLAF